MTYSHPLGLVVFLLMVGASFAEESLGSSASRHEGKLVICGGGQLPEDIFEHFINAAGGKTANLVVVPTASEFADHFPVDYYLAAWKQRGVETVRVLHTRSSREADDEQFVAPLRSATAVWFHGGYQSRLSEVYVGTRFEAELQALLRRGGVIGGTSAGAAIMSRLMIAGGKADPRTGVGFDLLPDAVIDQHFLQRNRQPRLRSVVERHPGRFGVGIDEGTALIVQGTRLAVLGESVVTVCLPSSRDRAALETTLAPGAVADLNALRREARDRAAVRISQAETIGG